MMGQNSYWDVITCCENLRTKTKIRRLAHTVQHQQNGPTISTRGTCPFCLHCVTLWFWHLIGAKFHVAMVVHVICSCAFVACAYRPPNRYETSLPYTRQCAVWNSRSDKIEKIYNQDSLQSAHTCNRARASPADVTCIVILRSRFASVVTCPRFVTRTSRDVPLCSSEAVAFPCVIIICSIPVRSYSYRNLHYQSVLVVFLL